VRRKARKAAACDAVQPAGPLGLFHSGLVDGAFEVAEAGGAQGGDGRAGIDHLVASEHFWARQVEKALVVLVDEAAALLVR
jgi:hypothetical protein